MVLRGRSGLIISQSGIRTPVQNGRELVIADPYISRCVGRGLKHMHLLRRLKLERLPVIGEARLRVRDCASRGAQGNVGVACYNALVDVRSMPDAHIFVLGQ